MTDKQLNRIYELWSRLSLFEHKTLLFKAYAGLIFGYFLKYKQIPRPIAFSLTSTVFMFALLTILPFHPMSIPTAVGGGLAFALIIY